MNENDSEIEECWLEFPEISEKDLQNCRETGDYIPILFEWYKYVGSVALVMSHALPESPALKDIPNTHWHVLIGLLNRCARLMLANIALSHEGSFGEATIILDRCIFESAIKIQWLCTHPTDEKFRRFYADSLRPEIEFKRIINKNIGRRSGEKFPIEERMLRSIERHFVAAQIAEEEVSAGGKMPPLNLMVEEVGMERLDYVIGQRMGSHHVHGSWSSLLMHYLEEVEGEEFLFRARSDTCSSHVNQFMYIPLNMLRTLRIYASFAFLDDVYVNFLCGVFDDIEERILDIYKEAIGGDMKN